jgi:single-strand DNA-binding protein
MSRGLNKGMFLGYVGADPEGRVTQSGTSVATFSLATTREWRNEVGQKQEKTEWHRCVVWSGLADVVTKYVTKGMRLYVEGAVEYRQYQDKDGQTRHVTEINVKELIMLTSAKGAGSAAGPDSGAGPADDPTSFNYGANAGDDDGEFEGEAAPLPAAKKGGRKTAGRR